MSFENGTVIDPAVREGNMSEYEQIRALRNKTTNFVFLFGKQAIGKTAITASIIHYLNTQCHYGNLEKEGNIEGQRLWEGISRAISGGRFPDRTTVGNVFEIESTFVPSPGRLHLKKLPLTFLEIAGENLNEVSINKLGTLPAHIDVFFKAGELSLTFILVTSYDEAKEDDYLMVDFLEYITKKSSRFRDSRTLLLISKWDKYGGNLTIDEFVKQDMPRTFQRLSKVTNGYGSFSLGAVEDEVDGIPYIKEYNSVSAKKAFEWIYQTLTGKKLG